MKYFLSNYHFSKNSSFLLLFLFLLESCANIVPPSGGEKDLTPPVLLSISPADSSLNKKISKIELHFNKFMLVQDLPKNLQISPLLSINPTVISYGKKIKIDIVDTLLKDNTTYRLSLGDALVDNRESNPYKNFVYIFSTGSYFDSLGLQGKVYDAATGLPDSTATILLYSGNKGDSAILKEKSIYAQKVDASGNFTFSLLPKKAFKIYAVQDINNNYFYDQTSEKIDFSDENITPTFHNDSLLIFNIFKEQTDTAKKENVIDSAAISKEELMASRRSNKEKSKNTPLYKVNADTTHHNTRTFEITQPLTIDLNTPLSNLDTFKVYLSYNDSGIEVQAIQSLILKNQQIKLKTEWLENKLYTLRLVKGWAKDTSGVELPPGKYIFRTKRTSDYSTLKIHIDSDYVAEKYVLYIYQGNDSIYQKPILSPLIEIPLLQPGTYNMRIIVDENLNGKWDSGDLFKKRHAEKVVPYLQDIVLKEGWENEVDFKRQKNMERADAALQKNTFSERNKEEK